MTVALVLDLHIYPILLKLEVHAVIQIMALLAAGADPVRQLLWVILGSRFPGIEDGPELFVSWFRDVQARRAVAAFATDTLEERRLLFIAKAARVVEANHVTRHTFAVVLPQCRALGLVHERLIRMRVR